MARQPTAIDKDKLRVALRKMSHDNLFYFLDDAIDILSPTQLRTIAKDHIDLKLVRPDPKTKKSRNLLAEVRAFEKASLAREFHESFNVNSKNYREKSNGTLSWIAECRRLLARCVESAKLVDPAEVRQAFDILFSLLDRLDSGNDEILFFADEAGAWQVGVQWEKVLPPWFSLLAATTEPEEYAERIVHVLKQHYHYGSGPMLAIARKKGSTAQRQALAGAEGRVTARTRV